MLVVTLLLYYTNVPVNSTVQYIVFLLYAGGIIWTLLAYYRSAEYTGKFGDIFGKGFRCFIVVAVVMVTFTGIFSAAHPEFAEKDADNYREYLKKEEKDRNETEREEMVASLKKHYTLRLIYSASFGYLITGAIFTAAGSALLLLRRK
jgi:hypothetical protein